MKTTIYGKYQTIAGEPVHIVTLYGLAVGYSQTWINDSGAYVSLERVPACTRYNVTAQDGSDRGTFDSMQFDTLRDARTDFARKAREFQRLEKRWQA